MNKEQLKAKLNKAEISLQELITKKKKIDGKIKEKQAEISALKSQISETDFAELQDKLKAKGLSFDKLKTAIETQDFSILKAVTAEQDNYNKL